MISGLRSRFYLALQELKLVRSPKDFQILARKTRYLSPRLFHLQHQASDIPASLQLEPTNVCNLRCISCPSDRSTRQKGYMEMALFREIIDEAAEIGVERVHFYLHGEPFLHPHVSEMLSYIKSRRLSVHVTTNGSPLDKPKIKAVLEAGLDLGDHLIFSILGHSKDSHERIMRNVNHERVLANIEEFVSMRRNLKARGPIFEAILYTMPENQNEASAFLESWRGKVDHVRIYRASRSVASYKTGEEVEFQRRHTCPQIWERLTIYWNGDATICCGDFDGDYILGNVRHASLKALWNHEKLKAVRGCHSRGEFEKIPICKHCDM
jgi:radical SAM protein with 4Fe4S-binding SPASM domain